MCMEFKIRCTCGARDASFHFQDNILPTEAVERLYCPTCSSDVKLDPARMVADNGWIIEYDMEVVGFSAPKLPADLRDRLTPATVFDRGYATWRGVYPGDHIDSVREREEIVKLAKVDPKEYMNRIKTWANDRMERLASEGWRKANAS